MPRREHLVLVVVVSALLGACSERPAECDGAMAAVLEALTAQSASALAPRVVDEAKLEVERAVAHMHDQEQRWRAFRRWNGELCRSGGAALQRAQAAVTAARATRDDASALEQRATATLSAATGNVEALAAFVDGGLVGPALAERIGTSRGAIASAQSKLALTLGELRGGGFVGGLEQARRVEAEIDAAVSALTVVADGAFAAAIASCRPKAGGATPAFASAPHVLDRWMVWRGMVRERAAVLVFRLDRARRSCRQVAARIDDDLVALERDDEVRVWHAGGRVPTAVLTGWNDGGAWFVPQAGGMFAFAHDRAARFVTACLGKVTCERGELGATTVEANCTCELETAADLAIGDRARRVRYVWDGRAVRAEL